MSEPLEGAVGLPLGGVLAGGRVGAGSTSPGSRPGAPLEDVPGGARMAPVAPSPGLRPGVPLENLPDSARVWIFGLDPELPDAAARDFLRGVDAFLNGWAAHGTPLEASRSFRYRRFLFVGVDERATPPSGCAVDALVRAVHRLAEQAGARPAGNEAVWRRAPDGKIAPLSRPAFRREARAGRIDGTSIVFDNTICRMADLRAGRWEGPASERWHAALLP